MKNFFFLSPDHDCSYVTSQKKVSIHLKFVRYKKKKLETKIKFKLDQNEIL